MAHIEACVVFDLLVSWHRDHTPAARIACGHIPVLTGGSPVLEVTRRVASMIARFSAFSSAAVVRVAL
jgi:hypothetical protein